MRTVTSKVSRVGVLRLRVRAQQLDRDTGTVAHTGLLDVGAQDTGPDGGRWALAIRGVDVDSLDPDELVLLWTIRGAPHFYRRADLPSVAAAVSPWSDADAAKRIFDAAKPLKAAGIPTLEALDVVAAAMRKAVATPMVKGEVSAALTAVLDEPYQRDCRPCRTRHVHEMPFRLAAVRAGLELAPGTSPPVLKPVPGFAPAERVPDRLDVVRGYLRLLGPATPQLVAGYLDAPLAEVRAHWPPDAAEVLVEGERRWVLAGDRVDAVRLLGPYDVFLQARDRPLLVADPARSKALWPVLGRPGAVLADSELVGTWRPRQSGKRLEVLVDPWARLPAATRRDVEAQAERLAAHRGVSLSGVRYAA